MVKKMQQTAIAKVVIAIALLIALGHWPYGYYQLLRWATCGICALSAYQAHETKRMSWTWAFGILAVTFNPIAPIYLTREIWEPLDILAGALLAVDVWKTKR